jgi:peptide/nickel transport system permease protein
MSFEWKKPVIEVIGERLGLTVVVALTAVLVTWILALPIGIYSAVRKYSAGEHLFTFLGFVGIATPDFLIALVLMYLSFQYFGVSVAGLFSPEYAEAPWSLGKVLDLGAHLWIPAVILGTNGTARVIRVMRANLLDELRKPYVVTARAKGLPEWKAVVKYPVRVALNPFVSTIGYTLPYLMSGSIIVSIVLNLPTVGPVLLRSLVAQDMLLAGTIVMFLGILTVIGTLASDILLAWLDPRIRLEQM